MLGRDLNFKGIRYLLLLIPGVLLLTLPLLRDFHLESAMIAGVTGCFWAAINAAATERKSDFWPTLKIAGAIYLMGIPPFIYALLTNCLTFDGFAFWLLTPLPSVFFGAAIGRALKKFGVKRASLLTVLVLLLVAVGVWIVEFFNFPQVYFFNHVWGIWPGPIYDEAVHISGSYIYFRWITFLWVVVLWFLPDRNKNRNTHLVSTAAIIALLLSYVNLDEMRIISPTSAIQERLGAVIESEHFTIYYDSTHFNADETEYWRLKHEFYFEKVINALELVWPEEEKISSYLYAHAWQKKKLTGAKFTSYVPVWLNEGQLHIAKQQLDDVLHHEVVHVISREFGNSLYNGSWSIGLIEGFAEALAKDASSESTLHQIVAAEKPYPTAKEMETVFSMWGFYGNAGAISYTTTGSFIEYLLEEFPASELREAYARGDLEEVYGRPFEELVTGWHQKLEEVQVDSVDRQVSEFIFAQRSLFQKTCPHSVSTEQQLWDDYHRYLASEDTLQANQSLSELYRLNSQNELVFAEWIRSKLYQNQSSEVLAEFNKEDTLLTLKLLKADALLMQSGYEHAVEVLKEVAPDINKSMAPNLKYSLQIRQDSLHWRQLMDQRYQNFLPEVSTFTKLNHPSKMITIQNALRFEKDQKLVEYTKKMISDTFNSDFFDIYLRQIDRLIFLNEFELSESILKELSETELRERYKERLGEMREWQEFIKSNRGS